MLKKLMNKLVKIAYPNRDVSFERIGGRNIIVFNTISCNSYKLEGTYSYTEVKELNELTGYSVGFGYCEEFGPVALIGIPNTEIAHTKEGDWEYKVRSYGSTGDTDMKCIAKYKAYDEETAKHIGNYSVYGLGGKDIEVISKKAPIAELNCIYDSRYKAKEPGNPPRIFDMDVKVKGTYSYLQAKLYATGSIIDKNAFSGEDSPIAFGILESGEHVGLIGVWPSEVASGKILGFRDVWEYGCERPKSQKIKLLNSEEAKKYDDYSLYIHRYDFAGMHNREKYQVEKRDRTLDDRFNFHLPDGTDYRLIPHDPC